MQGEQAQGRLQRKISINILSDEIREVMEEEVKLSKKFIHKGPMMKISNKKNLEKRSNDTLIESRTIIEKEAEVEEYRQV